MLHPLPGHSFRAKQNTLGYYALPRWEQKRGLPRYSIRSRTLEETKCNSGKTETEWDATNTPAAHMGWRQDKQAWKQGSGECR
jgi:hypothetical protein